MRRLLTAILLMITLLSLSPAQDDGVIRIDTDLVLINASVIDGKGQYIANLQEKDFLLEEEGIRRQIAHFAAEEAPFAAAVLIDASGSMKTKLGRARVAATHFAESLRTDDVVSVYGFNTVVDKLQDFAGGNEISPDIWDIEAKGLTRLYDALYTSLEALGQRAEQRRAIILISDGGDTNSQHTGDQVIALALKVGATIYSVDISESNAVRDASALQGGSVLKNFADKTGGQYLKTLGGQQLNERLIEISKELRSQYTIGFYADKRGNGRFRKLKIRVPALTSAQVRARQGYFEVKEK
jgi:Ca-activated chloride channel homolog